MLIRLAALSGSRPLAVHDMTAEQRSGAMEQIAVGQTPPKPVLEMQQSPDMTSEACRRRIDGALSGEPFTGLQARRSSMAQEKSDER